MSSLKWWQTAVFYQIYPRSFADGNGDGIGDFKGITEKLDYLSTLGVDALWLSPHFPSPNWDCGYDISDYCNVAPEYGTLDDFKRLLDEAHQRQRHQQPQRGHRQVERPLDHQLVLRKCRRAQVDPAGPPPITRKPSTDFPTTAWTLLCGT